MADLEIQWTGPNWVHPDIMAMVVKIITFTLNFQIVKEIWI